MGFGAKHQQANTNIIAGGYYAVLSEVWQHFQCLCGAFVAPCLAFCPAVSSYQALDDLVLIPKAELNKVTFRISRAH